MAAAENAAGAGVKLVAEKLSIARGQSWTLRSINARLEQGQITAICGPNGVGKSTLLMGLAGLIEPRGGMVVLDDKRLDKYTLQERAKRIGYLPQSAEVAWDVSVANLVRLGRLPHRDRGERAVETAIAALDLQALRHRPASQLSGGEKARALLARVLAGEPEWILADEPLAALDLAHQLRLLKYLRQVADQGAGVVVVLHDLATAMNHADRVIVLEQDENAGAIASDGSPAHALSSDIISRVWGVEAQWVGEKGARALTIC